MKVYAIYQKRYPFCTYMHENLILGLCLESKTHIPINEFESRLCYRGNITFCRTPSYRNVWNEYRVYFNLQFSLTSISNGSGDSLFKREIVPEFF